MAEDSSRRLSSRGSGEFRRACAVKLARENGLRVDAERQIVATRGAKEGLMMALLATINPGDAVLVEDPGFVSHGPTVELCGGVPVSVPLDADSRFAWPRTLRLRRGSPRVRALILANPQNPTGVVRTKAELEVIATLAREYDLWVISDEIYERAVWGGRPHVCLASLPGMRARTITLMSLTKTYAMGDWRIGFVFGPEPVIEGITKFQGHAFAGAPSFVQRAAALALTDPPPELSDLLRQWERRIRRVAEVVDAMPGVRCRPPEGGFFVWVDLRERDRDDAEVAERLLVDHGVAMLPGSAFGRGGAGFLRLSAIRDEPTLERALERLSAAFRTL